MSHVYGADTPFEHVALDNVSLSVGHGEFVGLIGHTGSGKSTVVKLIERFYDVTCGSITVDGVDVRDVSQEALRAQLEALGAFVYPSQAPFLLADFGFPVEKMAENLRKKGVLVRSCMSFDDINDGRHLRLAVKDEASNQKLIATLREVMICAEKA